MPQPDFGQLKKIPLRDEFPNEERDFTPWLQKNLQHLENLLKITIKEPSIEHSVGNYECDLFAHDLQDRNIVIENQYKKSDQRHLGEIETYATNLDADIVIWIAEEFNEEHIKVFNDRNENSSNRRYFAVKVNIWKIDDSKSVPVFSIITQPTGWDKELQINKPITDRNRKYLEFFTELVDEYSKISTSFSKPKPRPQNWISFGAGKFGFKYVWYFERDEDDKSKNWPTVSFETGTQDKSRSREFFEYLNQNMQELKKELPEFEPDNDPNNKHSSLCFYYSNKIDILSLTDDEENKVIKWMVETMKHVEDVMSKYVNDWK